tara:strand:+ start:3442 stop:3717 length:276 start_codon:yes stop_codon:yes gene_type:complete
MAYSAADDLSEIESELAKILFVLGLDWANIDTLSIDNILDKIKDNYTLTTNTIATGVTTLAADDYVTTQHRLLALLARRLWYKRHLALGVS